jgi:hypothetical protein
VTPPNRQSRPARRAHGDAGSISAFVVVMTVALVMCAGLVFDGGRLVGARVTASDRAAGAARAGAQEIAVMADGRVVLDATRAAARARAYLGANGTTGRVSVVGARITVTVDQQVPMTLLRLAGVGTRTVTATRTAVPVDH